MVCTQTVIKAFMSDQDIKLLDLNIPIEEVEEHDDTLDDVLNNSKVGDDGSGAENRCIEAASDNSNSIVVDNRADEQNKALEEKLKVFTLPEGWKVISKQRKKGMTKGRTDKYWISPDGTKYTSLIKVKRSLKRVIGC